MHTFLLIAQTLRAFILTTLQGTVIRVAARTSRAATGKHINGGAIFGLDGHRDLGNSAGNYAYPTAKINTPERIAMTNPAMTTDLLCFSLHHTVIEYVTVYVSNQDIFISTSDHL